MLRVLPVRLAAAVLLSLTLPAAAGARTAAAPEGGLAGIWLAEMLGLTGKPMRLVLQLETAPDASWRGRMVLPDQGFGDVPVAGLEVEAGRLSARIPMLGGSYTGTLEPDSQGISGSLKIAAGELPLRFRRIAEMPPLVERAQTPRPPFPYRTEEVSFVSPAGGIRLAGTLTVPPGPGPHPAAVFLSVAGPNDRDQSIGNHKIFLVLADALTRRGFAVLRWDDRGVGGSAGDYFQSTYGDLAEDALSGFRFLAARPEIDRGRVGFVGHSEGTAIASLAASRQPDAAFLILLGGLGLPVAEALEGQTVALSEARGAPAEEVAKLRDLSRHLSGLVLQKMPADALRRELRPLAEAGQLRQGSLTLMGKDDIDSQLALYSSPWYLSQFGYQPSQVLRQVRCPVLALSGSLDPVLPARENLLGIHRELAAGGNPDVTIMKLPGINHLLQTARTGLPIEYGSLDETISPRVLDSVTQWLVARFAT